MGIGQAPGDNDPHDSDSGESKLSKDSKLNDSKSKANDSKAASKKDSKVMFGWGSVLAEELENQFDFKSYGLSENILEEKGIDTLFFNVLDDDLKLDILKEYLNEDELKILNAHKDKKANCEQTNHVTQDLNGENASNLLELLINEVSDECPEDLESLVENIEYIRSEGKTDQQILTEVLAMEIIVPDVIENLRDKNEDFEKFMTENVDTLDMYDQNDDPYLEYLDEDDQMAEEEFNELFFQGNDIVPPPNLP